MKETQFPKDVDLIPHGVAAAQQFAVEWAAAAVGIGEEARDRLAVGLRGSSDLLAHAVLLAHAKKNTDVSMLHDPALRTSFAYGGRVTSDWAPLKEVIAPKNGMSALAEFLRALSLRSRPRVAIRATTTTSRASPGSCQSARSATKQRASEKIPN